MHLIFVLRGDVRHILGQLLRLRVDLSLEDTKRAVSSLIQPVASIRNDGKRLQPIDFAFKRV